MKTQTVITRASDTLNREATQLDVITGVSMAVFFLILALAFNCF